MIRLVIQEAENKFHVDRNKFPSSWSMSDINQWVEDCVQDLKQDGKDESAAIAICKSQAAEADDLKKPGSDDN